MRLVLSAAFAILVALAFAGWGVSLLFERHVERRVVTELEIDLRQLISGLDVAPDGAISLGRTPSDPRYSQPLSGVYWQVNRDAIPVERSRSLWDEHLALPDDQLGPGERHRHVVPGPGGVQLLIVERRIRLERPSPSELRFSVAMPITEIADAVEGFRVELAVALLLLGGMLLLGLALALSVSLLPLESLRRTLADLREGRIARLDGDFPGEVRPLVDDLNDLLEDREQAVERARSRAADLAHGLKTPLAAVAMIAEDLEAEGRHALASELANYTRGMHGHVERQLLQVRAQHRQVKMPVAPVVTRLLGGMRRLPRGEQLSWECRLTPDFSLPLDEDVVGEILGNLLDNARKWARSRVLVAGRREGAALILEVEDDGVGILEEARQQALGRGHRLDETQPGTGLGLAIVSDLVDSAGGTFELRRGEMGGLLAHLRFAAPDAAMRPAH